MEKKKPIHQLPEETQMVPCEQGQNIKDISQTLASLEQAAALRDATVKNISQSLVGIEAAMKEQTQLLRDVAVQNVRIVQLEKVSETHEGHFTELYNRMRAVESLANGNTAAIKLEIIESLSETEKKMIDADKKLDRLMLFVDTVSGKPFLTVLAMLAGLIVVGTICDIAYHRPLIATMYGWFK